MGLFVRFLETFVSFSFSFSSFLSNLSLSYFFLDGFKKRKSWVLSFEDCCLGLDYI